MNKATGEPTELPLPQTSPAGDSTWPGVAPGPGFPPWHHLSASTQSGQSLGSKTVATGQAGGAWLLLPDPRASLSNPGPKPARREGPSPRAGTSWRGRKWRGADRKVREELRTWRGRGGSESRPRVRVPCESPPGSATREGGGRWRRFGAGGRSARPTPPGPRLGLTSLTSPCQSLSVRSPFMASSSAGRGPAARTPPSSASASASASGRAAAVAATRAPRGPARAWRLRATAPPPPAAARAVDSTSASAGGRGGGAASGACCSRPGPPRAAPGPHAAPGPRASPRPAQPRFPELSLL